jgi:hypothetical protein
VSKLFRRVVGYMRLHKITELYTEWFSLCPKITIKHRNIAILKNFVKNSGLNKLVHMSMIFLYTKLNLPKCSGSWVVSIKQNINFNYQPPPPHLHIIGFSQKLPCEDLFTSLRFSSIQHFTVPHLMGVNVASTSVVSKSTVLESSYSPPWDPEVLPVLLFLQVCVAATYFGWYCWNNFTFFEYISRVTMKQIMNIRNSFVNKLT